jgi:UDP-GlcNAc:undecaprenyl-phosphate GlcNAc-1-phosphate transferase
MILYYAILSFFWAFLISLFAIPSIIQVAHKKQLLDTPNRRRLHISLTPRLGGLAIFAGFISALTIFGVINNAVQNLIAACIIIFFIGLKDDMVSVSAFKKFFVQFLAACIILFLGNIRIVNFHGVLGIWQIDEGISYFFSLIVILGITNAMNLIDGLDGLAASLAITACTVYGTIFLISGNEEQHSYVIICLALIGSLAGFLKYNIYKAIIFMGDTGSLISGFIIAFLAIEVVNLQAVNEHVTIMPALAIAGIIIPVSDTIRVFALRLLKGESPFAPDKNHLHHRLTDIGMNQPWIVFTEVLYTVINVLAVIMFEDRGNTVLITLMFGSIGLLYLLIELVYNKKKRV